MAISPEEAAASCAGTSGSRTVTRWVVVRMVSELAGVELLLLSCVWPDYKMSCTAPL
jgi:hypothetical protein